MVYDSYGVSFDRICVQITRMSQLYGDERFLWIANVLGAFLSSFHAFSAEYPSTSCATSLPRIGVNEANIIINAQRQVNFLDAGYIFYSVSYNIRAIR